jgi:hypothetical protein
MNKIYIWQNYNQNMKETVTKQTYFSGIVTSYFASLACVTFYADGQLHSTAHLPLVLPVTTG